MFLFSFFILILFLYIEYDLIIYNYTILELYEIRIYLIDDVYSFTNFMI